VCPVERVLMVLCISTNMGRHFTNQCLENKNNQSNRTQLTCWHNCWWIKFTLPSHDGGTATLHSISDACKPFAATIGTITTSWTSNVDGITHLLVIPESLYFGDRLGTTLLCFNQLRNHGIVVEETPRLWSAILTTFHIC
jgi:hypothetical protein